MTFSRKDTKAMKGIAILLMLTHHLFLFPERLPVGYTLQNIFSFHGMPLNTMLGILGSLCIPIFMFLGGYGLYCRSYSQESRTCHVAIGDEIWKLYCSLWKVMLVFVPMGFIFFGNQPTFSENSVLCHKFSQFSSSDFILSFTGLGFPYNDEWWFFSAFLTALFAGAVFLEVIANHSSKHLDIGIVFTVYILSTCVFPALGKDSLFPQLNSSFLYSKLFALDVHIPIFFLGIVTAKYDGIVTLKKHLYRLRTVPRILLCLVILALIAYQYVFISNAQDRCMVYVPFFIASATVLLEHTPMIKQGLLILGKNSTNIWLIHSFYCFYFGAVSKCVCISRNPILSLAELVFLSLLSSIALDKFWNIITRNGTLLLVQTGN